MNNGNSKKYLQKLEHELVIVNRYEFGLNLAKIRGKMRRRAILWKLPDETALRLQKQREKFLTNHDLIIIIFIWSLISYEILTLNLAHYYHYNSLQIIAWWFGGNTPIIYNHFMILN